MKPILLLLIEPENFRLMGLLILFGMIFVFLLGIMYIYLKYEKIAEANIKKYYESKQMPYANKN